MFFTWKEVDDENLKIDDEVFFVSILYVRQLVISDTFCISTRNNVDKQKFVDFILDPMTLEKKYFSNR